MTRTQVPRWSVGLLATLALATFGLLYANATLLAATLIPLAYVLYGSVSSLPEVDLRVERSIESATAAPGSPVEVTVTAENASESVLPDVRLVDGVPEELVVTEGTPRLCASLSPGEQREFSYRVVARRGTYAFDRPVARARSLAGTERETRELDVEGDDELVSVSAFDGAPRQSQTTPHVGPVAADSGGSGLEFHSTRQYRQGDPVNRIDWHHVAKTGEFITVQYREQKTSRTVLVVDARPVARVAPAPGYPTAVDRANYAAEQLYGDLTDAGIETSVAAVGLEETERVTPDPAGIVWAGAGRRIPADAAFAAVSHAGTDGKRRASPPPRIDPDGGDPQIGEDGPTAHAEGVVGARARPDGGDERAQLLGNLPSDARVILCSPLSDNWPVRLARALARDHELIVVSPDPVNVPGEVDRPGQRIAAINRQLRLRELRRARAETVDWPVDEPLEDVLRDSLEVLP